MRYVAGADPSTVPIAAARNLALSVFSRDRSVKTTDVPIHAVPAIVASAQNNMRSKTGNEWNVPNGPIKAKIRMAPRVSQMPVLNIFFWVHFTHHELNLRQFREITNLFTHTKLRNRPMNYRRLRRDLFSSPPFSEKQFREWYFCAVSIPKRGVAIFVTPH